jgi:hypothetical protein
MRTLIVILLSVVFSLNAAFAAVAGVCDAIDHLPQGGSEQHFHVDQHSHSVSDAAADERRERRYKIHRKARSQWAVIVMRIAQRQPL